MKIVLGFNERRTEHLLSIHNGKARATEQIRADLKEKGLRGFSELPRSLTEYSCITPHTHRSINIHHFRDFEKIAFFFSMSAARSR